MDKYTGGTLIFKRKEGNKEIITNINNLASEIKNMKESYANWEIYQTKEARFLPTNPNVTCAFILNCTNATKLLDNSIQSNNLDNKIKKKILPQWFYKKYMNKGYINYDMFETDRELAVLFGLPSNLIEGIIVNKELENNKKELDTLRKVFPECYICNIDGIVI